MSSWLLSFPFYSSIVTLSVSLSLVDLLYLFIFMWKNRKSDFSRLPLKYRTHTNVFVRSIDVQSSSDIHDSTSNNTNVMTAVDLCIIGIGLFLQRSARRDILVSAISINSLFLLL